MIENQKQTKKIPSIKKGPQHNTYLSAQIDLIYNSYFDHWHHLSITLYPSNYSTFLLHFKLNRSHKHKTIANVVAKK